MFVERMDTETLTELRRDGVERTCCDLPDCPVWGRDYLTNENAERVEE